jgi:hypothetical protein
LDPILEEIQAYLGDVCHLGRYLAIYEGDEGLVSRVVGREVSLCIYAVYIQELVKNLNAGPIIFV